MGMWPHFTFTEIVLFVGARSFWKAPDWGLKALRLADAWRRFRRNPPADNYRG
jgi:hypothetical protein